MEKPVIILGATALGRAALEIFQSHEIIAYCFLDDDPEKQGTEIDLVSVMGETTDDGFLKFIGQKCEAFVAMTDRKDRERLTKMLNERRKVMPVNAVHRMATVASNAELGHGNLINAGAVVNAGVKIPHHCVINSNAVLEMGVVLGEFVQIGAGAVIGANVTVEDGAYIGAGAIVAPNLKIGKQANVAPGAVVLQAVTKGQMVVGNPAKAV